MTAPSHKRPLSPHLQVYRPQITSVLSITHRFAGIANFFGIFVFVWWLVALATGPEYYDYVMGHATTLWGKILLLAWSFSVYYHMVGDIRHLFWDFGKGFSLENVTRSGIAMVLASIILTLATWWLAGMGV